MDDLEALALLTGPTRFDLKVYRGDSMRVQIRLRKAGGGLYTLTGLSGRAHIRQAKDDAILPISLAVAVDQTDGSTRGTIVVSATPEATGMFPQGGYWDLELYNEAGTFRKTILAGRLEFTRDVTV